ncbi:MAG: YkgJ family cysteine cluster protein [Desulfobacterales bacterium]|nr:YkgJ family cysteine cluster protein [Desulfobacterales bacterium]
MELDIKLKLLERMYQLYDDSLASYDLACRKFCLDCCTRNVTITTLEGYQIIRHLLFHDQLKFLERLKADVSLPRFQPRTTTNRIARLCAAGDDIPAEETDSDRGACPLLEDSLCRIYAVRPFGCRCLVSIKKCADTGCAEVDDFLLSVNTVFLQYIEHIDMKGRSGNLIDVLLWMESEKNRQIYEGGALPESEMIGNQPIPFLFVPPKHRDRMKPIINALQSL